MTRQWRIPTGGVSAWMRVIRGGFFLAPRLRPDPGRPEPGGELPVHLRQWQRLWRWTFSSDCALLDPDSITATDCPAP
jgi:hypothetical protein